MMTKTIHNAVVRINRTGGSGRRRRGRLGRGRRGPGADASRGIGGGLSGRVTAQFPRPEQEQGRVAGASAEARARLEGYGGEEVGVFFFSSRRRHTRSLCDWSSDVCSSD